MGGYLKIVDIFWKSDYLLKSKIQNIIIENIHADSEIYHGKRWLFCYHNRERLRCNGVLIISKT